MIVTILLSCSTVMVSAIPVTPNTPPSLLSQGGATQTPRAQAVEVTNQTPEAQTAAPLSPNVDQPQAEISQQPNPQTNPQTNPQLSTSLQQYTWSPQGGSPLIIPSHYGSQPFNPLTLSQQPLMFSPYGYFPLFSSPYRNQLPSPYGYPMFLESPLPQNPSYQLPNNPVVPAENTAGAAASPGAAAQPVQQQQNPQFVYMLQQQMSSPLGSLSSEELQTAAQMNQLGMYVPTVLSNQPVGAAQTPQSRAVGLTNPEQQGVALTAGSTAAGAPQVEGPACSGSQQNANSVPAGLERAAQDVATVQPKLQPSPGNVV